MRRYKDIYSRYACFCVPSFALRLLGLWWKTHGGTGIVSLDGEDLQQGRLHFFLLTAGRDLSH